MKRSNPWEIGCRRGGESDGVERRESIGKRNKRDLLGNPTSEDREEKVRRRDGNIFLKTFAYRLQRGREERDQRESVSFGEGTLTSEVYPKVGFGENIYRRKVTKRLQKRARLGLGGRIISYGRIEDNSETLEERGCWSGKYLWNRGGA